VKHLVQIKAVRGHDEEAAVVACSERSKAEVSASLEISNKIEGQQGLVALVTRCAD